MVQPIYDPEKVLNLRVEAETKRRLDALLAKIPTGAAKLSRHGLAVWCLERGLIEAERDPGAVLRGPMEHAPKNGHDLAHLPRDERAENELANLTLTAPAAPAAPAPKPVRASRPARTPAPAAPPDGASTLDADAVRARLLRARENGPVDAVAWSALQRATGIQSSGLLRFSTGQQLTLRATGLAALDRELTRLEEIMSREGAGE